MADAAAGVALAEGLHAASGLPVSIKWPNDLVVAPAGTVAARETGGILAEARTDAGQLTYVMVGFGISVGRRVPPRSSARATSMADELGRDVNRGAVSGGAPRRFATWLGRLRGGHTAEVVSRWRALAVGAAGSTVEWHERGAVRRGVTAGVRPRGALLVRAASVTDRIVAGEVTWL